MIEANEKKLTYRTAADNKAERVPVRIHGTLDKETIREKTRIYLKKIEARKKDRAEAVKE